MQGLLLDLLVARCDNSRLNHLVEAATCFVPTSSILRFDESARMTIHKRKLRSDLYLSGQAWLTATDKILRKSFRGSSISSRSFR